MVVKSFRGKISDGGIDTISLHTNNGSIGYKINKFQIMPNNPGNLEAELVCKIFSVPQTAPAVNTIDFQDNTLLAVAIYGANSASALINSDVVVFDNTIFNQDIYVTAIDIEQTSECNYYIELEMVKLDLNENTVATLKDIRNIEGQPFTSTP